MEDGVRLEEMGKGECWEALVAPALGSIASPVLSNIQKGTSCAPAQDWQLNPQGRGVTAWSAASSWVQLFLGFVPLEAKSSTEML